MIDSIRRGDICLVDLSNTVGSEQGGVRPAVVVQNEIGNIHSSTTIICPLTSKTKNEISTHVFLSAKDCGVTKDSIVLCEQIRVISKERIKKKLGEINNIKKMNDINKKIIISLGLSGQAR